MYDPYLANDVMMSLFRNCCKYGFLCRKLFMFHKVV